MKLQLKQKTEHCYTSIYTPKYLIEAYKNLGFKISPIVNEILEKYLEENHPHELKKMRELYDNK